MGWSLRLVALLVGLVSFASGLWPVGIFCFLWLAFSFRPKRSRRPEGGHNLPHPFGRYTLGGALLTVSAAAAFSGGTLSPVIFLAAGALVLLWPTLRACSLFSEAVPVEDSILLRSKHFPFVWYALAEAKAGPESFPRALSSFTGTLVIFTETGRVYSLAKCCALGRVEAEDKLLDQFRSPLHGAYLLPLDAGSAADAFRAKLAPRKLPPGDLAESAPRASGVLTFTCSYGTVDQAGYYDVSAEASSPSLPASWAFLRPRPLLWEVLDSLGKRTKWPGPDAFSNLLDSLVATKGEPLAERLKSLEGSEGHVAAESLAGESLMLSRPQLRAMVAIYS
jgi:hypothetical protein